MKFVLDGDLADRDVLRADRCPIVKAVSVIGTRSAFVLLREASYGTTRFDDFARRAQITEAVAATRLKELVAEGLLDKRPYREEGQRTRYEYHLTEMGRDLLPALTALASWGDRYLQGDRGPALSMRHGGCGEPVTVEVRCAAGHRVDSDEVMVSRAVR